MNLKCICPTCRRHLATTDGLAALDSAHDGIIDLTCPTCGGKSVFHFDILAHLTLREFTAKIKAVRPPLKVA